MNYGCQRLPKKTRPSLLQLPTYLFVSTDILSALSMGVYNLFHLLFSFLGLKQTVAAPKQLNKTTELGKK